MTDEGALNDVWPVRGTNDGVVGRVTAGAWSPRLERNIGYAWVHASYANLGAQIELADPHGARPATVAALPFVDPNKDIPRG